MEDFQPAATESALARSRAYRLLSYCFLYPDPELWEFLRSPSFEDELRASVAAHPLAAAIGPPPAPPPFGLAQLVDEHVRLLALHSRCPPYETRYHGSGLEPFSTEEMADVAGFYRAFGLVMGQERPDHVAAELEFLHLATLREAEAAHEGRAERQELCVGAERQFLEDHLGRWLGSFGAALREEGSVFYSELVDFLGRWVAAECAHLGASPQPLGAPSGEELEEEESLCGEEEPHAPVQ